ncbi:MAG: hypothetical protein HY342_01885 [Candidatus Lambdaproteobacteria bacterium]|nr:hypothetical protein [Candidatus Lambdaproteobacteria bacterium]
MTRTRCFVAFELAEESRAYVQERLAPLQTLLARELPLRLRPVPAANWHATLLFFPGLEDDERAALWEAVAADVAAGAWRGIGFDWQGFALWPTPRRPGMLCLVGADYPAARDWPLYGRLEQQPFAQADLRHVGRFVPHITLMRAAERRAVDAREAWTALAPRVPPLDPRAVRVERISLFLSVVSRERPIYPRVHSLPLD